MKSLRQRKCCPEKKEQIDNTDFDLGGDDERDIHHVAVHKDGGTYCADRGSICVTPHPFFGMSALMTRK